MSFIEWEDLVCDLIADSLEISRSNAQGMMEANPDLLNMQWSENSAPQVAALVMIGDKPPANYWLQLTSLEAASDLYFKERKQQRD